MPTFLEEQRFDDAFNFNLKLLSFRIEKLRDMNQLDRTTKFEYITYFDAIVVQFRAMLLERRQHNFTFRAFLEKKERTDLIEKIDAILEQPLDASQTEMKEAGETFYSLKKGLKFITDKFVCHNDNTDRTEQGMQDYVFSLLTNPHGSLYLPYLWDDLSAVLIEYL